MFRPEPTKAGIGQESVWDYPRPPRLERTADRLRVMFAGVEIANTVAGFRVLETSHPPVYYLPPVDVVQDYLRPAPGRSWCEFKGDAQYWALEVNGQRSEKAAWSYPSPSTAFADIAGCLAFYASRIDVCWVGDKRVHPQDGDFYGGWITSRIVGPFKGGAGSRGW